MSFKFVGKAVFALVVGAIFGTALEKGRVFEPRIIMGQWTFTTMTMLKFFLCAAGTAGLFLAFLTRFRPTAKHAKNARRDVFDRSGPGVWSGFIGGSLIGTGMAIGAICPPTMPLQLGSQLGLLAVPGAFLGTFLYFVVEPYIRDFRQVKGDYPLSWDKFFGVSYPTAAIGMAVMFYSIVIGLEMMHPWTLDIPEGVTTLNWENWSTVNWLTVFAWPPWIGAIVFASSIIPLVWVLEETLGASSWIGALITSVCQLVSPSFVKKRPCMVTTAKYHWQTFFMAGACLAGFLLAKMDGTLEMDLPSPSPFRTFIGAVIVFFGARFGGGCTSGHGVSGNGKSSVVSMAATCGMFGLGIALFAVLPRPW